MGFILFIAGQEEDENMPSNAAEYTDISNVTQEADYRHLMTDTDRDDTHRR